MKNTTKRLLCTLIAAVMSLGFFAGCGGGGGNSSLDEYKDRPNKVRVLHNKAGYGDQWINDVAKYYMDNIDTTTYIEIKNTPVDAEEGIKLASGIQTHDIYLLGYMYDYSSAGTYLADLSDIYNGKSTGEDTLVKDKIDDGIKKAYYPEGRDEIYYLPYGGKNGGYMFCYNTTTLDEAFGAGNYTLPRTTDELFEFGDKLKAKGIALTAGSYGDATDYFSLEVWLAQAMGVENYLQARNGYYKNDDGEYVFAEDYPYTVSKYEEAYEDLYATASRLSKKSNAYIHKDSNSMTFLDVESVLCGVGFGTNKTKIAYLCTGSYLLNEASDYLDLMEESGKPQTLRATKFPVMSSVIKQTPTINDDAKLREVIDYVDGKTTEKPSGVSDDDLEVIRSARSATNAHLQGSMALAKKAQNIEGCKEFIRFMTSDVAQEIASKALGGLEMLPYGYSQKVTNLDGLNDFVKDCIILGKDVTFIPANITASDNFMKYGGYKMLPYGQAGMEGFTNEAGLTTPQEFYNNTLNYYLTGNRWQTIISDYKKAMG